MRAPSISHLLPVLLVTALAAGPALAEDDPPPLPYGVVQLLAAEADLPWGWTLLAQDADAPADGPRPATLGKLAEIAGLDPSALTIHTRRLKGPAKKIAYVSVVAIEAKPEPFRKALDEEAGSAGWIVRELGHPRRLLVVSGPEKTGPFLADYHAGIAVYGLCEEGSRRIKNASDRESLRSGVACLAAAGTIEPNAGVLHALRGLLVYAQRNRDAALELFRKALDPEAPLPPKGPLAVQVAGHLGQMLLELEDDEVLPETLRVLQRAIAWERYNGEVFWRFGNRYNLACTFARLGRIDEAFEALEESLARGRNWLGERYARSYEHARTADPDMESLRSDPRFAKLMKRYAPPTRS